MAFYEKWGMIFITYMISTMFLIFLAWGYEGFPKRFTELDIVLIIGQLSGLGVIVVVPSMVYFLSRFKIVRRE